MNKDDKTVDEQIDSWVRGEGSFPKKVGILDLSRCRKRFSSLESIYQKGSGGEDLAVTILSNLVTLEQTIEAHFTKIQKERK